MILVFMKLRTPKTPFLKGMAALDWLGSITIVGSVVMFLLGLEFGGVTYPWTSATVLCLIILGLFTGFLFFLIEWRIARYPIMPLGLFRSLQNTVALLVTFFHGIVFISAVYYLPLYFQSVLGATPLLSGVWFMPFALFVALSAAGTGVYIEKTGRYVECVIFGFSFLTLGLGLFIALPTDRQWAKIIIFEIIAGIGIGPNFQAPLVALQTNVQPQENATATATFNFIRNIGSSISVVIGSVLFSNELRNQRSELARVSPQLSNLLTTGNAQANVFAIDKLPDQVRAVGRAAIASSLQKDWIMFTAFAAVGMVISFFVRAQVLSQTRKNVELGLETEEAKYIANRERQGRKKGEKTAEV